MIEFLTAFLLVAGMLFIFVAALGVARMPDFLIRMHASTKAGTLGAGLLLTAVALHFAQTDVTFRTLSTICFLFLTAPISAHLIGRSAYRSGIKLYRGTCLYTLDDVYPLTDDEPPETDSPEESRANSAAEEEPQTA